MSWSPSPCDYLLQLCSLVRDPIYRGTDAPKGQGQPILLIPGFLGGDWTLLVLAGWLNRLGYRSYFSGINWNVDCPNRTGERLRWRLDAIRKETSEPVTVIGHSLGGTLARFLGANFPDRIQQVITLGAPLTPDMRVHPLASLAFQALQPLRLLGGRTASACGSTQCSCNFARTVFAPLPKDVHFTSIFTKQDEIVDWHSSLDPDGDNREVSGRHIGLIVNREVYHILADRLAPSLPGNGSD